MTVDRIGLRFRDVAGAPHTVALALDEVRGEEGGVVLSTHTQPIEGGVVVRAMISNPSGDTVRLDSVRFDLATGFSADAPARFFKHGYQSWSASHPVDVGVTSHPRDAARAIVRLAHQSEVTRPIEAPEAATSELFTIVESSSSHERFLAGFIGAANQLTTITVMSPDRAAARALFDGVKLRPGEDCEVEPLAFWRSAQDAARLAARWAAMIGDAMRARVSAPYQRGWCS
jgi:hypothetical protein